MAKNTKKEKQGKEKMMLEIAWEVCNQVGGIYTVIRSKVPAMVAEYGENYCLMGPYFAEQTQAEFEPITGSKDMFGLLAEKLNAMGIETHYGYWLVTGKPKMLLFNPYSVFHRLGEIKYLLWENHMINCDTHDPLIDKVLAFGEMVRIAIHELVKENYSHTDFLAHFHEWMAGSPVPQLRRDHVPVTMVFTTHATLLGRYLAMNDEGFYHNLPFYDWAREAKHFNIETSVKLERAAAHGAEVFTTVSDVTAKECSYLLGRTPEVILPNGLNIERFVAMHEFQNLHQEFKTKIHQFVMGHFFQCYHFDLDNTLYFFTSGRFEYKNKGFDLTLEALARLNYMMQKAKLPTTVIMFFVTRQPYHSINPAVLQSRAVMEEIRQTTLAIQKQVGERLFYKAASGTESKLPDLNQFVDEYWRLRLRRTIQSWKSKKLPPVVTHNLVEDSKDEILAFLRQANLVNNAHDRVKIVYHPDFINSTNPLFGLEYGQFVRGCHMGVFPSYYEPWGYTPLECIASGVPAVTSDLSGFGDYVLREIEDFEEKGMYVVTRMDRSFDHAAQELANKLFEFVQLNRRDRITLRNDVEKSSVLFDWSKLLVHYKKAYKIAFERKFAEV